jgi:hypothetical protein
MSIQVGNINVINELIDTRFKVLLLEKLVEKLVNAQNATSQPIVTQEDVQKMREEIYRELSNRFPELGLTLKS